jgi:EAL domain-containing protein (putative c-di-GMP-specific phosphodiesterase class I)
MLGTLRNLLSSGASAPPACYVLGAPSPLREQVAATVGALGVGVEQFGRAAELLEAAAERAPDLVFIDISVGGAETVAAVNGLARLEKRGAVQLISPFEISTYEQVCAVAQIRQFGDRNGLKMLSALQPPLRPDAIKKVVQDLGLRRDDAAQPAVTLAQALRKDWLELWYQPKIDLGTKRLTGAEGLIRVRHPEQGVLFPGSFLPGASEDDMLAMTERVITAALRDWETLAQHGVSVKLAVNAPVSALTKLPIPHILRKERPKAANWPGLILEVTEDEIVKDLQVANDVAAELRAYNCSLAIDDFGAGYSSLARLRQLPFSELKIDRSYVTDCHADRTNAGLCETIVELAHRFGLKTVAEGIETTHESHKLQGLGCNVGQGYLFAKPMALDQFVALVCRRVVGKPQAARSSAATFSRFFSRARA